MCLCKPYNNGYTKTNMRIGIDYISALGRGGNSIYTRNLLKALGKEDKINQYYLYSFWHNFLPGKKKKIVRSDNFYYKPVYLHSFGNNEIIGKFVEKFSEINLSYRFWKDKLDFLHFTNPLNYNPRIKNFIVTIHDLAPLHSKEWVKDWSSSFYFKHLSNIIKKSKAIIAVSDFTKRDILEKFKISPEKIFIIYEAALEIFKRKIDKDLLNQKYKISEEYILSVGQLQPRKNLSRLIESYALLSEDLRKRYQLVLIGKARGSEELGTLQRQIERLKVGDRLKLLGYVPEEDLPYLYSGAALFVYPSLFEGFGLPIIEALSCGTPTITSNISSLPEVIEDAGVTVNPYDVENIQQAMEQVLTDNTLYQQLQQKSLIQAKKFDWAKAAQETIKVYEYTKNI